MKKIIHMAALAGILSVLFSCRKPTEIMPPPGGGVPGDKPDTSSYLRLSVTGVTASNEALFALVSIETTGGQPVITNKKVALHRDGDVHLTDKMEITKGAYKLTKLLLTRSSDTALYAAPKAQTSKAAQVPAPLALPVDVTKPAVNTASVQVLAILERDAPESFGYTNEDFGYVSFIHLRTKISIRVGTVLYDSLPGKLVIDAINAAGNHWHKELELARGVNDISVPEKYASFSFEVAKWNTKASKLLGRQELQPNMILAFSASRNPKRLIGESSFVETAAGFVPDDRIMYQYENNLLSRINYYRKTVEASELRLTGIHRFRYSGNTLDTIFRYTEFSNLLGYTAFFYQNGKISNILEKNGDQSTGAAVAYYEAGGTGSIEADYLYSNGNTMNYKMYYRNGNKISDYAASSKGGGETATYTYDDNINPYHQLGYPDLLFARTSKNNLLLEQRNYQGNIPSAVAYKHEYTYDEDGYPEELLVSYKGYASGQHLYRIRRVFVYG